MQQHIIIMRHNKQMLAQWMPAGKKETEEFKAYTRTTKSPISALIFPNYSKALDVACELGKPCDIVAVRAKRRGKCVRN